MNSFGRLLTCVAFFCSISCPLAFHTSRAQEKPNIVLIMADDVSWEAFGCYGGQDYDTPNIDRMAENGLRFSHCYSTPICTTSRVKLMTGKYNFRNYTHFGYLDPSQKTIGNLLQAAGYKTAIAGKWQLNGLTNLLPGSQDNHRPNQAGFDEYLLWQLTKGKSVNGGGGERYWSPVFEHNGKLLTSADNENKYGPDLMCDFVCDFIERNQQGPFFVYYPMLLVHDPFVPTPDTIGDGDRSHAANKPARKDAKKNFVAMVNYMDKIVGRIVDQVERVGQLDNTIILFIADNGTNVNISSRWQGQKIRGGKGGMTDMGTHVPCVAYWQGRTPEGKVVDRITDFADFFPTLAEIAGVELGDESPNDGLSFYPHLIGQHGKEREWVFCHYQPYWNKKPGQFVRTRDFKLYRDGRFYNLGIGDLLEEFDLSEGQAGLEGEQARRDLSALLDRAPPAPVVAGSKDTVERPIYPDWKRLAD